MRVPLPASSATLALALGLALLAGCGTSGGRTESRPLPQLRPAQFANLPALQARLELEQLDHTLLAAAIFHETNRVRRGYGLRPFGWLPKLDEAAALQANSVALDQSVGHFNLLPSLYTVTDRLQHVGLPAGRGSENAALLSWLDIDPSHGIRIIREDDATVLADDVTGRIGQPHTYASFAEAAVRAWMDSPGHRANILHRDLALLGCSTRSMRRISSIDMIACIQVFYTPGGPRRAR